jgi:excinuclease ABC subunit B
VEGKVIFYADKITDAMQQAIDETARRREKQIQYNLKNQITPASIKKSIDDIMASTSVAEGYKKRGKALKKEDKVNFKDYLELDSKEKVLDLLKKEMLEAAESLDFEKAAELRDRIFELEGL